MFTYLSPIHALRSDRSSTVVPKRFFMVSIINVISERVCRRNACVLTTQYKPRRHILVAQIECISVMCVACDVSYMWTITFAFSFRSTPRNAYYTSLVFRRRFGFITRNRHVLSLTGMSV